MFHVPESCRAQHPNLPETKAGDRCGLFVVKVPHLGIALFCIASDGEDWAYPPPVFEHVSVSLPDRIPTWDEMCLVKAMFWDEDDCVIQYHSPRRDYVNFHPNVLHLWRPVGVEIPRPPRETV